MLRFFGLVPFAAISFSIVALVSRIGWIAVDKVSGSDPESVFAAERTSDELDVAFGTLFSNLAMYFIILTTTLTLHGNGITNIETSHDAAAVLMPLAGAFAATLF